MSELSRTIRRTPAPLPTTFRPMSDAITGGRQVMLSTDPASRRALRRVGKVAATTGDTIHIDHAMIPRSRLDHVVAHELTHVANPSPTPRFFDDIDDSPEERRAERVAAVMARSPLAPSSSVAAPPGQRRTIRRSPSTHTASVDADALAATIARSQRASSSGGSSSTGGSTSSDSSSTAMIRRTLARGATATPSPDVIRREPTTSGTTSTTSTTSTGTNAASFASSGSSGGGFGFKDENDAVAWFEKQLGVNMDSLVRMIEDRMIVEVERRGGRTWRTT